MSTPIKPSTSGRMATERRRGERRTKADRRDEIRFEMKGDRRTGKDRRKTNNAWNESR